MKSPEKPKQTLSDVKTFQTCQTLCEWTPVADYVPEFLDTELDIPSDNINVEYFQEFEHTIQQNSQMYDILLAHKIIDSGLSNFYGECIPLHTNWNILLAVP